MPPVSNKLYLWHDSAVYFGDSFDPQLHRHQVVQCCFALEGKLRVRFDATQAWQSREIVMIGPNVSHQILNPEGPLCILYLEKTSNLYQSILSRLNLNSDSIHNTGPILKLLEKDRQFLSSARSGTLDAMNAETSRQRCLEVLSISKQMSTAIDPRIAVVVNTIQAHPTRNFTGAALAEAICLSESRMQHLFKQEIGVPIRAYALWAKIRRALVLVVEGETLSIAAHASGFSDSSHLTRTFKSMFGLPPSALFGRKSKLDTLILNLDRIPNIS